MPYAKQSFKLSFKLNEKKNYYLLEFGGICCVYPQDRRHPRRPQT